MSLLIVKDPVKTGLDSLTQRLETYKLNKGLIFWLRFFPQQEFFEKRNATQIIYSGV